MTKQDSPLHFRSPTELSALHGAVLANGTLAERAATITLLMTMPNVSLDRVDEPVTTTQGPFHLKGVLINSDYPSEPVFVPDEVIDYMVSKGVLPAEIVPNATTETADDINNDALEGVLDEAAGVSDAGDDGSDGINESNEEDIDLDELV